MFRILTFCALCFISLFACKKTYTAVGVDKTAIAKRYFNALNTSNGKEMKTLLGDSLFTSVSQYDYRYAYTTDNYINNWMAWDAVFNPEYKILDLKLKNNAIVAKVSKTDKRIHFLQAEPFITTQTLRFKGSKIHAIETAYITFRDTLWMQNKTALVEWIAKNHPELDGFIYDQTKDGGLNYLKAIQLYQKTLK